MATNRLSPATITRHTSTEHTAARVAFSVRSPVFDTSPRTSRENAFSSRSSASVPAASSSVMNMSDTVRASATANEVSDVAPPFSAVAFTRIGSPTTASTSSENDRFSRASRPKAITRSS
jgi:hypothetical protein